MAGRRAGPLRPERADRRDGADEHAARQPGGHQEGDRDRWPEPAARRPEPGRRRPAQRRDAADDGQDGVRRRPRPRHQQGRGRLPGRRHRAHPVLPHDAAGARAAAADRAAADRPVLLPRPAAGAQLRRVRGRPGPADVHDQLAQPDAEAGRLEPRHLRRARAPGHRRGTGDHGVARREHDGLLRRRDHLDDAAQPPRRDVGHQRAQRVVRGDAARLRVTGADRGVLREARARPRATRLEGPRGAPGQGAGLGVQLDAAERPGLQLPGQPVADG